MLSGVSAVFKFKTFGIPLFKNAQKYSRFIVSKGFRQNLLLSRLFSTNTENTTDLEKLELQVQNVCKGDPVKENKMRVLMLELQIMKEDGRMAPDIDYLKTKHWEHLMSLTSKNTRHAYLTFLFKNSKSNENLKIKKEEKKKVALELMEELKAQNIPIEQNYRLCGSSMFIRIYEKSMNKLYNFKALQAMLYGQKIILDCSYDEYMTHREAHSAAKQFMHIFSDNRTDIDPFDIYFCNVNKKSTAMKSFLSFMPSAESPDYPIRLNSESYLDLFPKDKLVYLTPHCRTDLIYDPDDIYIIGAMVDKARNEPLSAAKAKEYNIRMARLPLNKYLQWNPGSGKSLGINHVFKILLDYKTTRDWNTALLNVPRRKITPGPEFYDRKYKIAVDKYLLAKDNDFSENNQKTLPDLQSTKIQRREPFFTNRQKPVMRKNTLNYREFGLKDESS